MVFLDNNKLLLAEGEIYRAMGAGDSPRRINPQIRRGIAESRRQALDLIQCAYVYQYIPVTAISPTSIQLDHCLEISCSAKFFQGATRVAIAVITVGPDLVQKVTQLFAGGEPLQGMILDAYGTVALDELLGYLRSCLAQDVAPYGEKLGYSLSPGCKIALEGQHAVFALLSEETKKIGVSLQDSGAMYPTKSCSYITPVGKELVLPTDSKYVCDICEAHQKCIYSPVAKPTLSTRNG
jgi:hypothetical protein